VQNPGRIQHPKHRAAAATEFIVTLNYVAFDLHTTYDRTSGVSQSINQSYAPVHTITTQYGLTLAFEGLAHLYQPPVAVAEAFVFAQKMPR
jgi:hypothetical protein